MYIEKESIRKFLMELFRIELVQRAGFRLRAIQFTTKIIFMKIKIIFVCEMCCVRVSGICVIFYGIDQSIESVL